MEQCFKEMRENERRNALLFPEQQPCELDLGIADLAAAIIQAGARGEPVPAADCRRVLGPLLLAIAEGRKRVQRVLESGEVPR